MRLIIVLASFNVAPVHLNVPRLITNIIDELPSKRNGIVVIYNTPLSFLNFSIKISRLKVNGFPLQYFEQDSICIN